MTGFKSKREAAQADGMTKEEALKLALEALETHGAAYLHHALRYEEAITAIKEALAQPEQEPAQEPVAWMDICEKGQMSNLRYWSEPDNRHEVALYTTPPTAPVGSGLTL
jgi:hypothetical protein